MATKGRHGAYQALGLAAGRLGVTVTEEQLAREYATARTDPTLADLQQIADKAGLKARAADLTWSHLEKVGKAFPIILRMKDDAWYVAEKFVPGETPVLLVSDPSKPGARPIPIDRIRLESAWSGEALFLKRRLGGDESEAPFGFHWMLAQVMKEKALMRDVALSALTLSVLTLVPPILYMLVLDRVMVHHRLSTLFVLILGIGIILAFDTALGAIRRAMIALAAAKIDARVSIQLFDRLLGLPIDFFEHNPTGVIAHKLGEARRVRSFVSGQLFAALLDATTLLVLVPAMFMLNATLASFVLTIGLIMGVIITVYMGPIRKAYQRVLKTEHAKTQMLIETIQGMRTVKSLALEGRRRREWDRTVAEAVDANTSLQRLANQPQTLLAPFEKLIYAGSLALGSWIAISSDDPIMSGTLVAFTMIATRATQPIAQLAGMMQQVQEARGAIEEVASVVNALPEPRRANGVKPALGGHIAFSDVRFSYIGASTPALNGISFEIQPGTVVGVMGRSGSGKTTVTRLLQGLHAQFDGLIKFDGIDLREIDLDHLRANMGVVLQDNFLFSGTIRDNIMIARPDGTAVDMIEAARLAGAEEFIERLPRGYETMIEEGGANLSGGQRQRLAIARALVTNPRLLIFDEATSALDPESEAIINVNLKRMAAGRTVIVISHRLASLVDCDQILVLDRGQLMDSGRHQELLARSDVYRLLWNQQNRHINLGPVAMGPVTSGASHGRLPVGQIANG
jgi:ATP-binding cassette subfamily B protein